MNEIQKAYNIWRVKVCNPTQNAIFKAGYKAGVKSVSTPPLYEEVDCPECGGSGFIVEAVTDIGEGPSYPCLMCDDNAKIRKPIYYTPEAYETWMHDHGQPEFKILDTDPVWIEGIESPWFEWDWSGYKEFEKGEQCYMRLVGQPKPPVEESVEYDRCFPPNKYVEESVDE